MKLSAIIAPLVEARAPHDQIMAVILAFEAQQTDALEQRRKTDAERQARHRSRDVTLRHSDRSLMRATEDKTSNLEIEPQEESKQTRARDRSEFDDWYSAYPHKVQRGAAERAFPAARKLASLDELKAGLARYVASKPADRQWQNPATWLNGKGWLDVPAPIARAGPSPPRINPTLAAARNLMEQFDAVPPSEIEGNHPSPRLVAISGR